MTATELLQRQREILRNFRQIAAERFKAKTDADAEFNSRESAAETQLAEARKAPDENLKQVVASLSEAQVILQRNWKKVLSKTTATRVSVSSSDNPKEAMRHLVAIAQREVQSLRFVQKNLFAEGKFIAVKAFFILWSALSIVSLIVAGGVNDEWETAWVLVLFIIPMFSAVVFLRIAQYQFEQRSRPYATLLGVEVEARQLHEIVLRNLRERRAQQIAETQTHYHRSVNAIKKKFAANLEKTRQAAAELTNQIDQLAPNWTDGVWHTFTPSDEASPIIRLGQLQEQTQNDGVAMPLFLPFLADKALIFSVSGSEKTAVVPAMQSILLRLLANVSPGKLVFIFIDPLGLGQNVAPFLQLEDHDQSLIDSKAWAEPKHIEARLEYLTEHMGNVIQKYLRNQYKAIEEFNQQAGEVAEPYRILVVMNFPVNFSPDAARRLISIVQNGPRCGVHTVLMLDQDKALPYDFDKKELLNSGTVISWDGKRFIWQDDDFRACILEMEELPEAAVFDNIIGVVGKAAQAASKVEVPFEKVLERSGLVPVNWWTANAAEGIQVPLGPIGAKKIQFLHLGKGTAQHALVGGKTGSGKSTLLHVLITNLALCYGPDEVELYLIDFKKGVEFKIYSTHQLPHARVIAIESEREFGLSVIEGLDAELKRRGDLFRELGVDSLKDYRQKVTEQMSRILLVVDEFQEFFTDDDTIASKASQILDRLVRQGRAFGVHVVLGSQTIAGAYTLARSTIDQMAVRIALQCSDADSRLILSDDNAAARSLSRPGQAIYNSANGLVEGNNPFQVAWLSDKQQEYYLSEIQSMSKKNGHWPPRAQTVFEGNSPANPERNQALKEFLSQPQWSVQLRHASAWLGEPVALKPATIARFRRQSGSNLLIVGQNDEAALGILMMTMLSLCAQHAPKAAKFYILDFGAVDAPNAHFLSRLSEILPHAVRYGRRRNLPDLINDVGNELKRRSDLNDAGIQKEPAIYLNVYGLQRAHDLQEGDGFSNFALGPTEQPQPASAAKQFSKILSDGPDLGIHSLVWCDTVNNINRRLNRQALRELEMRIVFQMSNEDSSNLIDTTVASKLGQHRALFYSVEDSYIEKFRPYALPSENWLREIGEIFRRNAMKA